MIAGTGLDGSLALSVPEELPMPFFIFSFWIRGGTFSLNLRQAIRVYT